MTAWPWPPIQISDCEWVVMRHERTRPEAVIHRFEARDAQPAYFRVVSWAPLSKDRKLIGRFPTLEAADAAVLVGTPGAMAPRRADGT